MALDMVNVTVNATGGPNDAATPEGHFVFIPDGVLYPAVPNGGPIVPNIVQGNLVNGTSTVALVASDNFDPNVLDWGVTINIRGLATIHGHPLTINFADGADQSIWDILTANGWTPTALV